MFLFLYLRVVQPQVETSQLPVDCDDLRFRIQ